MIALIVLLLAVGTFAETQDCPDSITPIYIPDYSNCSLFYECIRGQKYQATCPPGLFFNSETKYCDLAEFVVCSSVDPTCPASGEISKMVYPDNCSKYYECKDGKKLLKDCPENLYFNPTTLQCDYMDNVDCQAVPSRPTNPSTPNTPASTRASTTTTTTPDSADPTCPASGGITKMVYTDDCSKYYECKDGRKSLKDCPENLYFNPATLQCDYMDNVDCQAVPSRPTNPSTPNTPASTRASTTTTTTPGPVDPTCPASGGITKMVYSDDCSKYYECKDGRKSLKDCPENLYFNPATLQCDYMDKVDCQAVPSRPTNPTNPSTESTRASTITTTTPGPVDPTCPASGGIEKMVYPDDCSKYYECKDRKKSLRDCPENLYFNPTTLQCDYMDNVDCQAKPTVNPTNAPNPSTAKTTPAPVTTLPPQTTRAPPSTTTAGPADICKGRPDGTFIGNSDNCRQYYECVNGKGVLFNCPTGTIWNEAILSCTFSDIDC